MSTPAARSSCCSAATSARSRRPAAVRPAASSASPSATRTRAAAAAPRRRGAARSRVEPRREPLAARVPRPSRARPGLARRRWPGTSASARSNARRAARGPAAAALQLAQQRADVGAVLRRRAAGGDRQAHRLAAPGEVAAAARAGRRPARSRRGSGLRSTIACSSRSAVVVAAELDQRVDAHERADRARARGPSASAPRKSWRASASSPAVASASGVRGVRQDALGAARRRRGRRSRAPAAGRRRPATARRSLALRRARTALCSAGMSADVPVRTGRCTAAGAGASPPAREDGEARDEGERDERAASALRPAAAGPGRGRARCARTWRRSRCRAARRTGTWSGTACR